MILASVDIGTNTALLLVAKLEGDEIRTLYDEERIVRLGEEVDTRRLLLPQAIDRTVTALVDYKKIAERYGAERLLLSGTSAVRDAANREALLEQIRQSTGIEMRVLSGEDEARLTWLGTLSNKKVRGTILMMDIGGGSTEFMVGALGGLEKAVSLDIGSVRLTERFLASDPPRASEARQVRECIKEALSGVDLLKELTDVTFIGVAGTITTLAAIHLGLENYDSARVDGFSLDLGDIETMLDSMQKMTLTERKMIKGLNPKRADVMVAGVILLHETMQFLNLEKVLVSDRGLRYGLALDYASRR
jgi:exopolyphosphatase/guanosine-5'-triphosphate,3'-diphosphate pyrophosphatase